MFGVETTVPVNLGTGQRIATMLGGAVLVGFGLGRRSPTGSLLAILGALLVQRGVTGHCPVLQRLAGRRAAARPDDVDSAAADSFPASDPPAWTPTAALGGPVAEH